MLLWGGRSGGGKSGGGRSGGGGWWCFFLRRNAIKVEFGDNQPQGGQRGAGWHLFRSISNPGPATKNVTAHSMLRGNWRKMSNQLLLHSPALDKRFWRSGPVDSYLLFRCTASVFITTIRFWPHSTYRWLYCDPRLLVALKFWPFWNISIVFAALIDFLSLLLQSVRMVVFRSSLFY